MKIFIPLFFLSTMTITIPTLTKMQNTTYVHTCSCASCGKVTLLSKRFHVYNYDFCTVKCTIAWRIANPPAATSENGMETSKSVTNEGWGNAF